MFSLVSDMSVFGKFYTAKLQQKLSLCYSIFAVAQRKCNYCCQTIFICIDITDIIDLKCVVLRCVKYIYVVQVYFIWIFCPA